MRFTAVLGTLVGAALCFSHSSEAVLDVIVNGEVQQPRIFRRAAWEVLTEYTAPKDAPADIPERGRRAPMPGVSEWSVVVDIPAGKQAHVSVRMGDIDAVATSLRLAETPWGRRLVQTGEGIQVFSNVVAMMNAFRVRIEVNIQEGPAVLPQRRELLAASAEHIPAGAEVVRTLVREKDSTTASLSPLFPVQPTLTFHPATELPAYQTEEMPLRILPWHVGNMRCMWFATSHEPVMGYRAAARATQAEETLEATFVGVDRVFVNVTPTALWGEGEAFMYAQTAMGMIWYLQALYLNWMLNTPRPH